MAEPDAITRATLFADRHLGKGDLTNGLYLDFGQMIPGAGWWSGGPGYRRWYAKDRLFIDTSASISNNGYKMVKGRFELPKIARSRLALGAQYRWQDFAPVTHFGEGPSALEDSRSEYELQSHYTTAYATLRPFAWLDVAAQTGWLKSSVRPFSGAPLLALPADERTFVPTEVSMTLDARDFPGHPTRGVLARTSAARYDDRLDGAFSFRRYEAEAAGFVPIAGARVVLAAHGWLVASDTDSDQSVPFYLQPSLGGANTLRSYANFRFRDRQMLIANAELRVALMTHMDLAMFADAGNVAPNLRGLNLGKRSYGAGVRLHTRRATFAILDLAGGDEGWRVLFRLTDPLDLARLTRKSAIVPFVP